MKCQVHSSSFRERSAEILETGGSGFIFKDDSFVVKILNDTIATVMKRTTLFDIEGTGEILIEKESLHHTVGRFCYDMTRHIRGQCNIEIFEDDLKYLKISSETIVDMIYYSVDIKVEVEKEHRRQKEEKEEMERLERVELAKAALQNKKASSSNGATNGKKIASSQNRENNVNRNAEPRHVIRLVSNRMQREFGAKKRIKP